jgi:CRISPR/Cas system CSM-associated protein Csm3 (group 7 of RAMP superfamily)
MDKRYIAKIIIETETPLSIGSGQRGLITDRLVAKDANHLPYIPGTSLAGVLRHAFSESKFDAGQYFGTSGEDGHGSAIKISAAHLVGEDGTTVIEGFQSIDFSKGYYNYFNRLPERDHVRMNGKGVADAENHGKYDEQLVHKGTRFAFEMELMGNNTDASSWAELLNLLASPIFRIGAGTRKGFGKIKIIKEQSKVKVFDLTKKDDLLAYLSKSSSLNFDCSQWENLQIADNQKLENWTNFKLQLKAKDFFLFSAGFGDEDADTKPKTEKYFDWSKNIPVLIEQEQLLISATSVKGAIAHRTAYHYNLLTNNYLLQERSIEVKTKIDVEKAVESLDFGINDIPENLASYSPKWEEIKKRILTTSFEDSKLWAEYQDDLNEEFSKIDFSTPKNEAINALFGFAKDSDLQSEGQRGKVIMNDIYLPYQNDKVFNHVKIDRFTNGAIGGALFQEKAANYSDEIMINIWVENVALQEDKIRQAFESALQDVAEGRLFLGGNTTKGQGIFEGSISKN